MIIQKNIRGIIILLLILTMILTVSCDDSKDSGEKEAADNPPVQGDQIEATDYSDSDNWALLPENNTEVDVFCLYPTAYDGADGKMSTIGNEVMREGADEFMKDKASAFETSGNIYAPYYRQLDATWFLSLPVEEQDKYIKGAPLTDVFAAFDYYIKNYNEGRPFILMGHSQGSSMAKVLMEAYFEENPEVMDRMIAAYIIGYYVTEDEIESNEGWKFAEGEEDTGVIISYNTVSPDTDLSKLSVWKDGALSINPISWTRIGEPASSDENLGSYIQVDGAYKKIEKLADATVDTDKGVVICDSLTDEQQKEYAIPEEMDAIFSNGSYHVNDISFYYYNLRENAEKRVNAFLNANPQ